MCLLECMFCPYSSCNLKMRSISGSSQPNHLIVMRVCYKRSNYISLRHECTSMHHCCYRLLNISRFITMTSSRLGIHSLSRSQWLKVETLIQYLRFNFQAELKKGKSDEKYRSPPPNPHTHIVYTERFWSGKSNKERGQ